MSLKSKLSPEARLALRIANAIKPPDKEQSGISRILNQFGGNLLVPVLIGLGVGLGTNYFQAQQNLRNWQAEHKAEVESKLATTRSDLLVSFQQTITEYFSFDTETTILFNKVVLQNALKAVMPDFDIEAYKKNSPSFPTADQTKESTRIWSKLLSLSQSIKIYFGDNIGAEASSLITALNAEPMPTLDIHVAVEQLKKMKDDGTLNLESIAAMMSPYFVIKDSHRSPSLNQRLEKLFLDMHCIIARHAEIEPDLVSASCPN
jgi:hypothetical protein